ncbi:TPA: BsaG protein [Staphylococcus aureus]|nr:BsaG protein [Staphylococcus aureus]
MIINELKSCKLKFSKQALTFVPIIVTILFILFINWYLNVNLWNGRQISLFTASFNAITSLLISINVYQVINFEENIGHFNHILGKANRLNWLIASMIFTYTITAVCILLVSINLLWHSHDMKITLMFIGVSLFFNVIILLLLFIFSIFIKDVLAIVVGVLMFIFNVYFGLEVLGDHSWFYLPITYATRYVYMYIEGNIPVMMTMVIYIIIMLLLAVLLFKGFNKWSGRTIKD